jgi:hypothetical protein
MKIILDESAPQKLRLLINGQHVVVTTWFQGWSGLKNGALLAAAEKAGFDLFTADQEISYQQNLTGRQSPVPFATDRVESGLATRPGTWIGGESISEIPRALA